MVQSILASLPCAPSHLETDKYRIWEGAEEVSRLLNLTCVEQDAGFVSFVVLKYQVTQQSKRRLYLELLLEPGSNPWYVVVVVIFIYIYIKKVEDVWRVIYENYTFTSVFLSPHHCLSSLVLLCSQAGRNGAKQRRELPPEFQNKSH